MMYGIRSWSRGVGVAGASMAAAPELEVIELSEFPEWDGDDQDEEDNRIRFLFPDIPWDVLEEQLNAGRPRQLHEM